MRGQDDDPWSRDMSQNPQRHGRDPTIVRKEFEPGLIEQPPYLVWWKSTTRSEAATQILYATLVQRLKD
jgi:hypothetical protein